MLLCPLQELGELLKGAERVPLLEAMVGAIIVIGFLFSAYFTYIQGAVLKAYCTWCVLSAIEFLLLFLVLTFTIIFVSIGTISLS